MTLQEASSCFHLDIEMLRLYEESGFIRTEKTESGEPDYPEAELRKAAQLCALQRAGMELEELKKRKTTTSESKTKRACFDGYHNQ